MARGFVNLKLRREFRLSNAISSKKPPSSLPAFMLTLMTEVWRAMGSQAVCLQA
jgi:hypothetical protein